MAFTGLTLSFMARSPLEELVYGIWNIILVLAYFEALLIVLPLRVLGAVLLAVGCSERSKGRRELAKGRRTLSIGLQCIGVILLIPVLLFMMSTPLLFFLLTP